MESRFLRSLPEHVAIIMDGNGRWAARRGLTRSRGHHAGAHAARRIVEAAVEHRIAVLTLYAFSADNWQRPPHEVASLMRLLERYLMAETTRCVTNGVRVNVIGRRDRLSPSLVKAIVRAEELTGPGRAMHLRLAIDYSARAAILRTAQYLTAAQELDSDTFLELMNRAIHSSPGAPPVDLLIRTGGEHRLSDFLLWECAYAELLFSERLWPDFDDKNFVDSLVTFAERDRRYGRVKPRAAMRVVS